MGSALYQPTNSDAAMLAGGVFAGNVQGAVGHGAHRVDDRVMVGGYLRVGHVPADLDIEVHTQPGVTVETREGVGDSLRRLVVGRDAVPDQAAGDRQPVDQGDLGSDGTQERLRRVVEQRGRCRRRRSAAPRHRAARSGGSAAPPTRCRPDGPRSTAG